MKPIDVPSEVRTYDSKIKIEECNFYKEYLRAENLSLKRRRDILENLRSLSFLKQDYSSENDVFQEMLMYLIDSSLKDFDTTHQVRISSLLILVYHRLISKKESNLVVNFHQQICKMKNTKSSADWSWRLIQFLQAYPLST